MDTPKVDVQFMGNNTCGSFYTVQPDMPTWINIATSFTTQIDLVDYENNLFLTKQLQRRIYKEVFRISGETIRENFKETLTQNWFWASNEELIKLLKQYKTIPNNTVTQASLLQNIQNIPFRGEQ